MNAPLNDTIGAPVLSAEGLSLGYGRTLIIDQLSLSLAAGEVVALLGANGAGKTTTLLGLAGQLRPRAGHVFVDGVPSTKRLHARARDGLSFVTQERCVLMGMSVLDNLRVGGCEPEEVLTYFPELRDHARRRVGLLSGGQQQMLAVGRAIARGPRVLLADEISLGLSPMVVDRIFEVLLRASRDHGLAVVVVEQHVAKALDVSDRVAVLRRGKLELVEDSAKLRGNLDEVQRLYL